jgi:hypothetical protein
MANEFVAKNGLISQNNTTISGSLTVSASSGIPLQIKGGTGTLLSVSSSTSEIFKISDTFSPNLFTVSTGSTTVFNIDNNKTVSISGSLVVTGSITGSLQGTASFATLAQTASYVSGAVHNSNNPALSASYAATSSYVVTALTASYVTASNIAGTVLSSSYAQTASIASSVVGATPTEIGHLSGVTGPIQTQLDSKLTDNAWVDYSGTSTFTGWASFTTKKLQYKLLGANTMLIQFQVEGISNATSTSFTLPFPASSWGTQYFTTLSTNSGTVGTSAAILNASTSIISCSVNINPTGTNSWTATGGKNLRGQATINI